MVLGILGGVKIGLLQFQPTSSCKSLLSVNKPIRYADGNFYKEQNQIYHSFSIPETLCRLITRRVVQSPLQ